MSTETEEQSGIDRREALKRVTFMLGGIALVGSSGGLLTACSNADRAAVAKAGTTGAFAADDIALLDEISDTILPTTAKSAGAKAAKTGAFMALMVTDTYSPAHDRGIAWDDPALGIEWPVSREAAHLSAKDKMQPKLQDAPMLFE